MHIAKVQVLTWPAASANHYYRIWERPELLDQTLETIFAAMTNIDIDNDDVRAWPGKDSNIGVKISFQEFSDACGIACCKAFPVFQ